MIKPRSRTRVRRVEPANAWFLQAVDLRAGLGFAVHRTPQTSRERPIDDWPCYFLSPPTFSPEPVDNVALALAATRGSFAGGLMVGDDELPFNSLEDVGEFMRRAFISGGGGDQGDGDPDGGPVPPGEPPGDLPPLESLGSLEPLNSTDDYRRGADESYAEFVGAVGNTPFGQSFAFDQFADRMNGVTESSALVDAALLVIWEMMNRYPDQRGQWLVRWLDDLRCLGQRLSDVRVWPLLLVGRRRAELDRLLSTPSWPSPVQNASPEAKLAAVFLSNAMIDDGDGLSSWFYYWYDRYRSPYFFRPDHPDVDDAFALLQRIPVPRPLASLLPADVGDRASLQGLLCAVVASPLILDQVPAWKRSMAWDLILLAASFLTCKSAHHSGPLSPKAATKSLGSMDMDHLALTTGRAAAWLAEHLPARGFSADAEALIESTAARRYAPTTR